MLGEGRMTEAEVAAHVGGSIRGGSYFGDLNMIDPITFDPYRRP